MTFQEAQAEFQRIIRSINGQSSAGDLLQAQRQLDSLTDRLRGREGFDSIRAAIDEIYPNLVGGITDRVLAELKLRDDIFARASTGFANIHRQAERSTKTLALERTKLVLPALEQSLTEVKGMIAALKHNNTMDAVARGQSLLAVIEKVKEELAQA